MPLNPRKKIIIRVWHSGLNIMHRGETTGHVSIATTWPEEYISLWPEHGGKKTGLLGMRKILAHEFKINYQADLE